MTNRGQWHTASVDPYSEDNWYGHIPRGVRKKSYTLNLTEDDIESLQKEFDLKLHLEAKFVSDIARHYIRHGIERTLHHGVTPDARLMTRRARMESLREEEELQEWLDDLDREFVTQHEMIGRGDDGMTARARLRFDRLEYEASLDGDDWAKDYKYRKLVDKFCSLYTDLNKRTDVKRPGVKEESREPSNNGTGNLAEINTASASKTPTPSK